MNYLDPARMGRFANSHAVRFNKR